MNWITLPKVYIDFSNYLNDTFILHGPINLKKLSPTVNYINSLKNILKINDNDAQVIYNFVLSYHILKKKENVKNDLYYILYEIDDCINQHNIQYMDDKEVNILQYFKDNNNTLFNFYKKYNNNNIHFLYTHESDKMKCDLQLNNIFDKKIINHCINKHYENNYDIIYMIESYQHSEELILKIFLSLLLQKKKGLLVFKIPNTLENCYYTLLYFLSNIYENVTLIKPYIKMDINQEQYVICNNYLYKYDNNLIIQYIFNIIDFHEKKPKPSEMYGFLLKKVPLYFYNKMIDNHCIIGQQCVDLTLKIVNLFNTFRYNTDGNKKQRVQQLYDKHSNYFNKLQIKLINWINNYNI